MDKPTLYFEKQVIFAYPFLLSIKKQKIMKKSSFTAMIIVFLVAVIIYIVCTNTKISIFISLIPTIIIVIIAWLVLFKRGKFNKNIVVEKEEKQKQQALQDLVTTYGNPDDIIVTDATRGDEIDGVILAYDKGGRDGKGFFVCNGIVIGKASITDITFNNNFGTAFGLPDEFQVVISTNEENHPKCFIRAGNDIETAKGIIMQIKSHL